MKGGRWPGPADRATMAASAAILAQSLTSRRLQMSVPKPSRSDGVTVAVRLQPTDRASESMLRRGATPDQPLPCARLSRDGPLGSGRRPQGGRRR